MTLHLLFSETNLLLGYIEQILLEDEYLTAYILVSPTGALFPCKRAGNFPCSVGYNDNEPEQAVSIELDSS